MRITQLLAGVILTTLTGCTVGDAQEGSLLNDAPILAIVRSATQPHLVEFNGAFHGGGSEFSTSGVQHSERFTGTVRFPDTSLDGSVDVAEICMEAIIDEIRQRGGKLTGSGLDGDIKIAKYKYGNHEGFVTLTMLELKNRELRAIVVGEEHWPELFGSE